MGQLCASWISSYTGLRRPGESSNLESLDLGPSPLSLPDTLPPKEYCPFNSQGESGGGCWEEEAEEASPERKLWPLLYDAPEDKLLAPQTEITCTLLSGLSNSDMPISHVSQVRPAQECFGTTGQEMGSKLRSFSTVCLKWYHHRVGSMVRPRG